jgi:hypothetical protein
MMQARGRFFHWMLCDLGRTTVRGKNENTDAISTAERITSIWRKGTEGTAMDRFYVKAKSVNAVRRALGRAPGGVRVIGRFDRETIECAHTMKSHSLRRHWPVVVSRLRQAGLDLVAPPTASVLDSTDEAPASGRDIDLPEV